MPHGPLKILKYLLRNNPSRPVVPNLFLTVAHFHFEIFPLPYSQSIAQELDLNFQQSYIAVLDWNGFSGRKQVIFKKKVFTKINSNGFYGQKQIISKKKKSLQQNSNGISGRKQVISKKKKKCNYDFFKPKCSVAHKLRTTDLDISKFKSIGKLINEKDKTCLTWQCHVGQLSLKWTYKTIKWIITMNRYQRKVVNSNLRDHSNI